MRMRLVYASDLHGRESFYEELESLVTDRRPDALILGGDLLPRSGTAESTLSVQKQFIADFLIPWIAGITKTDIWILTIPGNDDLAAAIIRLKGKNILRLDLNGVTIQDRFRIRGYPYVPPTPFSPKDFEKRDRAQDSVRDSGRQPFITENEKIEFINFRALLAKRFSIEEDLQAIPSDDSETEIFVSHAPPFGTALDRLGDQTPVGSAAILEWINSRQPALSLHGHIHESPEATGRYWQKIGGTVAVNAGQNSKRLSAVCIELTESSIALEHTIYPPSQISRASEGNRS
jgi:Icc-related predicted phosphoesterase